MDPDVDIEEEEEEGKREEHTIVNPETGKPLTEHQKEQLRKRAVVRTPKFLRVTLENIAKHRALQLAYVERFLNDNEPVVGSAETVLTPEERAHISLNAALVAFSTQMQVTHFQINSESLPQGNEAQRLFFQIAARPPFALAGLAASSRIVNQLASLESLAHVMLTAFALYATGLLRLRKDLYLYVFEWRTEDSCHSCVALVVSVPLRVTDSWLPDTDTVPVRSVPPILAKATIFQYNGYVYADSCISGAVAGAPASE